MEFNTAERFSEVYSILKCLDEKNQKKIPKTIWREIERRKNDKSEYQYVPGDEQYLDSYTIAILNVIYYKYLKY